MVVRHPVIVALVARTLAHPSKHLWLLTLLVSESSAVRVSSAHCYGLVHSHFCIHFVLEGLFVAYAASVNVVAICVSIIVNAMAVIYPGQILWSLTSTRASPFVLVEIVEFKTATTSRLWPWSLL
jgi:hypothetical protein